MIDYFHGGPGQEVTVQLFFLFKMAAGSGSFLLLLQLHVFSGPEHPTYHGSQRKR